jgi:hypothetical protein
MLHYPHSSHFHFLVLPSEVEVGLEKSSSSTSWLGLAADQLSSDRLDAQNKPEPSLFCGSLKERASSTQLVAARELARGST